MKIRNLFSMMMVLMVSVLVLTACSDYDNGYDETSLKYYKDFEKTFGKIDAEQDWNLAERAYVTVTTSKPSRIKIYAYAGGIYNLVADYADVNSTQDLYFDVVEGTEYLMVSDGTNAYTTKIGRGVSFTGNAAAPTRAANYGTDLSDRNGNGTDIDVYNSGNTIDFTKAQAEAYAAVLPEIDDNTVSYDKTNLSKVTKNFYYVSNGSFSIYPVYWQTSAADEVGIYYTDANGVYHEVPVYNIKSGEELMDVWEENGQERLTEVTTLKSTENYNYGVVRQRSKEIIIDIPEGTVFGFYLVNHGSNHTFYSQAEKNPTYGERFGSTLSNQQSCYAASIVISDEDYLCFEDWFEGDFDLNDLVFKFDGDVPTIINEDPTSATWLLACEDLGGTFDYDFNDLVLKVEHISGQPTATITPLAAGGTLGSYIFFKDPTTNNDEICLGEIHQLFGQPEAKSGDYLPLNVGALRDEYVGTPCTVPVGEDWTMAYYSSEDFNLNKQYGNFNMGGISVRSLPKGTAPLHGTIYSFNSAFGEQSVVAAPGLGNVPEIFCLPYSYDMEDGYTYVWAWPREYKTIDVEPYPEFTEWVGDHTKNTDWYKHPYNTSSIVSELKWQTPVKEKVTPSLGGIPFINWNSTGNKVTGNQIFTLSTGVDLWMKLQVNGSDYTGSGTFSVSVNDANYADVNIWNGNEVNIAIKNQSFVTVKVTVDFSGDSNYNPTSFTYTIQVPKQVHFKSHANGADYGLAIKNGQLADITPYNTGDAAQTWYKVKPINEKGNNVGDKGCFWLCNVATGQYLTFNNNSMALELVNDMPIGAQSSRLHMDSNGWIWEERHPGNYFGLNGIIDGGCTVGLLRVKETDSPESDNYKNTIAFTEE